VTASDVATKRIKTGGRVLDTNCVAKKRISTIGRVGGCLVILECTKTGGRV
jgi:hypothetical protein